MPRNSRDLPPQPRTNHRRAYDSQYNGGFETVEPRHRAAGYPLPPIDQLGLPTPDPRAPNPGYDTRARQHEYASDPFMPRQSRPGGHDSQSRQHQYAPESSRPRESRSGGHDSQAGQHQHAPNSRPSQQWRRVRREDYEQRYWNSVNKVPYSSADDAAIINYIRRGDEFAEIGSRLERTPAAIQARWFTRLRHSPAAAGLRYTHSKRYE